MMMFGCEFVQDYLILGTSPFKTPSRTAIAIAMDFPSYPWTGINTRTDVDLSDTRKLTIWCFSHWEGRK